MVDRLVLAKKIAAVRDATQRVRDMLPAELATFERDRTIREVVVLNLFVALQGCLDLASHWYPTPVGCPFELSGLFELLATPRCHRPDELARRLVAASGFRNLVAHQYGALMCGVCTKLLRMARQISMAFAPRLRRSRDCCAGRNRRSIMSDPTAYRSDFVWASSPTVLERQRCRRIRLARSLSIKWDADLGELR